MGNSDLLAALSRLPEKSLEQAIIYCVEGRVCAGEYALADALIERIRHILHKRTMLAASLAALGVKIAVRTRQMELAIARFEQISVCGSIDEIINLQSDALYFLAEGLLPERPSRLFSLWQECLAERLPRHARFNLCSLGRLLSASFARIGDYEMVRRIGASLDKVQGAGR